MLATFLQTVLGYLREIAELIVRGFVVAGVLSAILNKEAVARHLGGRNLLLSNLLGAPIGVVTPLCCCSAIPTAMTLYRAGSRRGPACAFLSAPPWFNWYGLAALVIFLGPRVAVAVAGSAVLIAFAAGLLIDLLGPRPSASVALAVATPAASCTCGAPCCGTSAAAGRLLDLSEPLGKRRAGVRFALEQVRELGLWMLLGVVLGAAGETFIREDTFTPYRGGTRLLGLGAALVVAGLCSADSLGMLPGVQSLLVKGLGAGSAMILLIAGVGTPISTLGPVAQVMGRRTAVLYAASVVVLAAVCGAGLNRML